MEERQISRSCIKVDERSGHNDIPQAPNLEIMVRSTTAIIHSKLIADSNAVFNECNELFYFSEEYYLKGIESGQGPDFFDEDLLAQIKKMPSFEEVYQFTYSIFQVGQFSPETLIISIVYLNRVIAFTSIPLQPSNWRPLFLVALLISQKIWDDRSLESADFASIYPFFSAEELVRLENLFLTIIQYNVQITPNMYTTYYIMLREHYVANKNLFPFQPLKTDDMDRLFERSNQYYNIFLDISNNQNRLVKTIS